MKKICIVILILLVLFSGCATHFDKQMQNPIFSSTTTDGTTPSTATSTIIIPPTETHSGAEQWDPESGSVHDVSDMIIQEGQFRLDCLYATNNIMVYSDILADNIMVVPYESDFLKPKRESVYTVSFGMHTKMYIHGDILYTIEQNYETQEWDVKAYALLDGQPINTFATKDTFGYTSAKDAVLLFCTEENQQRIYRKNLVDGHEDTVLVWDTSDKFSKPIISDIVESENGFAFVGNIFTPDSYQSVLCCGFIDLHGNLFELNMYNDEQRVNVSNGGILVQDDIRGFDSKYEPDGKYFFYDLETMSIKEIDAQDPKCRIFISNNGKYLVAAYIEAEGFSFWVYDLIQGEYLETIHYKTVDTQVSQYDVSLDENKNGFYLLLKSNIKTQLIYFGI